MILDMLVGYGFDMVCYLSCRVLGDVTILSELHIKDESRDSLVYSILTWVIHVSDDSNRSWTHVTYVIWEILGVNTY